MQDETIAPAFSPGFEQYLQGNERMEAPTRRVKLRTVPCVMPDCDQDARRANKFPLCLNHLLMVWRHVERGAISSREMRGAAPIEVEPPHVVTHQEVEARRLAARQKQRELAVTRGTLYVLDTRDGLVKIGWTGRDLWDRLTEYPPMFRLIVCVPGTRADERDVHRSLKTSRVQGREWYEPTAEVARQINHWISERNVRLQQSHTTTLANAQQFPGRDQPTCEVIPRFTTLAEWHHATIYDRESYARDDEKLTTHRA